jgi:hypothetical protein
MAVTAYHLAWRCRFTEIIMEQSALFANQRQANLRSSIALIDKVLTELGHGAALVGSSQIDVLAAWQVTHGSASIAIDLINKQPFPHLRVCATVMTLDDRISSRVSATEFLLTENVLLMGAAFALIDNRVLLIAQRSTLDLDYSEIMDITKHVMLTADHYDDILVSRFGGQRGGRPV